MIIEINIQNAKKKHLEIRKLNMRVFDRSFNYFNNLSKHLLIFAKSLKFISIYKLVFI